MLNLRLVQPQLLVDITRIKALVRSEVNANTVTLGACVSHAAIEDLRVPDATHGYLARVASGIAYRAVRNRGTIGGSLANADPTADWLSCFTALKAQILISGPNGQRTSSIDEFVTGAMETTLDAGEMIDGVRFPTLSKGARCGYAKISRKPGEFADAIAAIVHDSDNGRCRLVVGTTNGVPRQLAIGPLALSASAPLPQMLSSGAVREQLASHMPATDVYDLNIQCAVIERALANAHQVAS
jgi:carbon-monoxide dehydrogenase medium subunit